MKLPTEFISQKGVARLVIRALLMILIVSFFNGGAPFVPLAEARTANEIKNDINSLNNDLSDLSHKIAELESDIVGKQGEIRSLENDVAIIGTEIDKIELEIETTQKKIDKVETEIEQTSSEIQFKEEEIGKTKDNLAGLIRLLNEYDHVNVFEIVVSGQSFSEMLNQFEYTQSIQNRTQEGLDNIQQLRAELVIKKTELERQRNEALVLRASLRGQRNALQQKRSEKDTLLALTKEERDSYDRLRQETAKKQQQVIKDISELESQLSTSGELPKGAPPPGNGVLQMPADGVLTQGYGMTDYAQGGAYGGAGHNGLDIAAPLGSPIFAAEKGTVVAQGDLGPYAYGRWSAIDHAELGFTTVYAHLQNSGVSTGDTLERGEIFAAMGSTGYSSGSHLHFMVCFDFQTVQQSYGLLPYCNHVDPAHYL